MLFCAVVLGVLACGVEPLPIVEVVADDTRIESSCRIRIEPGLVIQDDEGDGVIQVVANDVIVEFLDDSVLRGAEAGTPGDGLVGVGVRVQGAENVTLRGLRVEGYKVNVRATRAPWLVVEDADLSGAFRQRLRSTPQREDTRDWLRPHENDEGQWVKSYGGALVVEDTNNVTIRRVRVRESQNGIILDRVNDSDVYDNDCSFLSGWGLAMWRSSRTTISRNAFDFCIRGHEEGVYNRGQDSAGILMFEQCNDNIVVENSCTHSGDGIFAFGGREAIGQVPPLPGAEIDYADAGCNDNVFLRNDLSFCSAHGYEMTFSERNLFARNRLEGNGICGVWGGYSSDSRYVDNYFARNGQLAYGAERGGINIEHGSGNTIVGNTFENNRVGVRLWWDDDIRLLALPGVRANDRGVSGNRVSDNTFIMTVDSPFELAEGETLIGIQFENVGGGGEFLANGIAGNTFEIEDGVGEASVTDPGTYAQINYAEDRFKIPSIRAIGDRVPVGAREHLRGRQAIVMGEWGPWDHEGVLVRRIASSGPEHIYEFRGVGDEQPLPGALPPEGVAVSIELVGDGVAHVTVTPTSPGVQAYSAQIKHTGGVETISGRILATEWEARFWAWESDPITKAAAWREEADAAAPVRLYRLDLPFGAGGPAGVVEGVGSAPPDTDLFGMIAKATIPLDAGAWRVRTLSDDGVRVIVDGEKIIERWDIHGPTEDTGVFTLDDAREVGFVVEYFENDGYATLRVDIEPAD